MTTKNKNILDLCVRNSILFAIGQIPFNQDLLLQIKYALEKSDGETKDMLIYVFKKAGLIND